MFQNPQRIALTAVAVCLSLSGASAAQRSTPVDTAQWHQIALRNSLVGEGKAPFHLKMSFQLFDLKGQPLEKGVFEAWVASPKAYRLTVDSPSLHDTEVAGLGSSSRLEGRERYLVKSLLGAEALPLPDPRIFANTELQETQQTFGKVRLTCITRPKSDPVTDKSEGFNMCADEAAKAVRLVTLDSNPSFTRNDLGLFHETIVAKNIQYSLSGFPAISGDIVALESFDPAAIHLALHDASPDTSNALFEQNPLEEVGVPLKVIHRESPVYPISALESHARGSVILSILIAKDGTVSGVDPVSGPNALLIDAAVAAARRWQYEPPLLNGMPTAMNTTLRTNFNLTVTASRRPHPGPQYY